MPPDSQKRVRLPDLLENGEVHCPPKVEYDPINIGDPRNLLEVRFNLINFPFQKGNAQVKQYQGVEGFDDGVCPHRWALQTDDGWEFDIDPREDLHQVWKKAKWQASYVFTHVGRLRKTDKSSFHFDEAQDLLNMLFWFLSFVVGWRVGVVLPVGYENSDQPVFVRWDSKVTQAVKGPPGWYEDIWGGDDLVSMFQSFREWWRDDYWQEIVRRAIYAYTHAQEGTWGDVMMAQSGLETLAWAVLVKKDGHCVITDLEHQLTKKEFNNAKAADKLRRLLRWVGVPSSFPSANDLLGPTAPDLLKERDPSELDGPRAAIWTRNRIVHPRPGGASKLPNGAFFECGWALLGYIELVLLRLLKYQGY